MGTRLEFSAILKSLMPVPHVYFRSPSSERMVYPCFRYDLDDIDIKSADNMPYKTTKAYLVTYITDDPDDDMSEALFSAFQHIKFVRPYTADNLNHFVYKIFY